MIIVRQKQFGKNNLDIVGVINSFNDSHTLPPLTENDIKKAQSKLCVTFAKEFIEYSKHFGSVSIGGTELFGVTNHKSLSVVDNTIKYRKYNKNFPSNMYVISDAGIDGLVYAQDSTGKIYEVSLRKSKLAADSLAKFLISMERDEKCFSVLAQKQFSKNLLYNNITNQLVKVLPKGWEKVIMYAHIKDDMYEIFFYVKKDGTFYNCFKLDNFGITKRSLRSCFDKIHELLLPDYLEKGWYTATAIIDKSGKFVLEYTYDDLKDDYNKEEKFKEAWKKKYLKN